MRIKDVLDRLTFFCNTSHSSNFLFSCEIKSLLTLLRLSFSDMSSKTRSSKVLSSLCMVNTYFSVLYTQSSLLHDPYKAKLWFLSVNPFLLAISFCLRSISSSTNSSTSPHSMQIKWS